MIQSAIPVVHVSDAARAESFYCGPLGFEKRWEYRPQPEEASPVYMGLQRDGVWLHVSSFSGDGVAGSATVFETPNVDGLFEAFRSANVTIELEPYDQSWGTREMYVKDPDGNSLRFVQEK